MSLLTVSVFFKLLLFRHLHHCLCSRQSIIQLSEHLSDGGIYIYHPSTLAWPAYDAVTPYTLLYENIIGFKNFQYFNIFMMFLNFTSKYSYPVLFVLPFLIFSKLMVLWEVFWLGFCFSRYSVFIESNIHRFLLYSK